jgi:ribosomal protein RSM22 (predicted rRNA methylase)
MALAPQRSPQEFLVVYSAMKLEDLQKELLRAQAKFQAAIHVFPGPAQELMLTNWVWPEAAQVRTLLQQRVMQAVVDPNNFGHDQPLEIHAEGVSTREITSVQIQFPEEFQRVLVVAYKPTQTWAEPKAVSPILKF